MLIKSLDTVKTNGVGHCLYLPGREWHSCPLLRPDSQHSAGSLPWISTAGCSRTAFSTTTGHCPGNLILKQELVLARNQNLIAPLGGGSATMNFFHLPSIASEILMAIWATRGGRGWLLSSYKYGLSPIAENKRLLLFLDPYLVGTPIYESCWTQAVIRTAALVSCLQCNSAV